jgi:hypothetical protein
LADALLADIGKGQAFGRVKVTKLAMALTAETKDAACTQAFSKMQLDASLGKPLPVFNKRSIAFI